ncbi:G protein [Santa barbara virus]|uniref:G protein n=1 Tax=Santa barbara virus TaxID=1552661 RepID=A0A097A5A4_9RHAB|nr:G protein [Santa barbara virus]AIS40848.1 G protein [Santa barbara virus]
MKLFVLAIVCLGLRSRVINCQDKQRYVITNKGWLYDTVDNWYLEPYRPFGPPKTIERQIEEKLNLTKGNIPNKGSYPSESKMYMYNWPFGPYLWHELTPDSNIGCPKFKSNQGELNNINTKITVKRPSHPDGLFVKGYICEGLEWVLTCSETWYWSVSFTKQIKSFTPTLDECQYSVKAYESGEPITPYFPEPLCFWNADHTESIKFTITTQHSTLFDPYRGMLDDHTMVVNTCPYNSTYCKLKDVNKIWVRDDNDKYRTHEICKIDTWEEFDANVYFLDLPDNANSLDANWKNHLLIEGEGIGKKDLSRACRMFFCGIPGIRFPDREWWSIKIDGHNNEVEYQNLDMIPECTNNQTIGLSHPHFKDSEEKIEVLDIIKTVRCAETLSKIYASFQISPFDLSALAQEHPGIGLVFSLRKQDNGRSPKIYWSYANYKLIEVSLDQNSEFDTSVLGLKQNRTNLFVDSRLNEHQNETMPITTSPKREGSLIGWYHNQEVWSNEWYAGSVAGLHEVGLNGIVRESLGDSKQCVKNGATLNCSNKPSSITKYKIIFPSAAYKMGLVTSMITKGIPISNILRPTDMTQKEFDLENPNDIVRETDSINRVDIVNSTKHWWNGITHSFSFGFKSLLAWVTTVIHISIIVVCILIIVKLYKTCKRNQSQATHATKRTGKMLDTIIGEDHLYDTVKTPSRNEDIRLNLFNH